jgi:hypothetical protein
MSQITLFFMKFFTSDVLLQQKKIEKYREKGKFRIVIRRPFEPGLGSPEDEVGYPFICSLSIYVRAPLDRNHWHKEVSWEQSQPLERCAFLSDSKKWISSSRRCRAGGRKRPF